MIERLLRNPLALAGAFVASALAGALLVVAIQLLLPGIAGDKARVERIVRNYILEHPEILPEAIEKLRGRELEKAALSEAAAQKAVAAERSRLEKPYASAWGGNPDGDVTLVAFMDYACGYCRTSLPAIAELIARDPDVRVVYREFPVLGPESGLASRWALAAAEQGKFQAFHEALYAEGAPSAEAIAAAAVKAGLDKAVAEKAIRSKPLEAEIAANHDLGRKLAMTGTPGWVVGGRLLYGARDYASLAEAVAEARKAK
jgi:protein-disulfide isomerase